MSTVIEIPEVFEQKVKDFRDSWNKESHDWIFVESQLMVKEGILAVSFSREYGVHSDQNAYSMIYIFTEASTEPSRIYYNKFWDGCPEWRDASLFYQTLVSAEEKDGKAVLKIKTEDGKNKELVFVL